MIEMRLSRVRRILGLLMPGSPGNKLKRPRSTRLVDEVVKPLLKDFSS
jgi:hypothetical protein